MTDTSLTPLVVGGGVAVGLLLAGPIVALVLRRRGRTAFAADLRRLRAPTRLAASAAVAIGAQLAFDRQPYAALGKVLVVSAVAWFVVRSLVVAQGVVFRRLRIDTVDNLRARSRRTQVELIRRVVSAIVIVGAVVVVLLTVTPLGSAGPTIVTYAGLIGILLGFALRSPIENLTAGVIVAFAEPIRIDDVVVVEGEWGRIEHIGLVNVVVRIWDDRRLVLPTSRFVNEPFENWTRSSSAVTGTVTAWIDHTADVEALRGEVGAALHDHPLWDGRAFSVQVVELGERSVQVRMMVTASDASNLWDLRCDLRELLLPHLVERVDELPVVRIADGSHDRTPVGHRTPVSLR